MPSRRPPKRRCQVCGSDYYGWAERGACPSCLRSSDEGRAAADIVFEQRQLRLGVEEPAPRPPLERSRRRRAPVIFAETGDEIPY